MHGCPCESRACRPGRLLAHRRFVVDAAAVHNFDTIFGEVGQEGIVAVLCDVRGETGFELEQEVFILNGFFILGEGSRGEKEQKEKGDGILFIEISRAAAAADLGRSGDKVTMWEVRASRGRDWNRLDRNCARNQAASSATGGSTRCSPRGQERPRHTSILPATLFLKCICRGLVAWIGIAELLGLDGRSVPTQSQSVNTNLVRY